VRRADVFLGGFFAARVSGKPTVVLLSSESVSGGWEGINQETGRPVRIRTAARLRYRVTRDGSGWVPVGKVATDYTGAVREVRP
jgi:hypothetical protein